MPVITWNILVSIVVEVEVVVVVVAVSGLRDAVWWFVCCTHTDKITLVLRGHSVSKECEQKCERNKPTEKYERLKMLDKASDQAYDKNKV